MKKLLFILIVLLGGLTSSLFAQAPAADPDTLKNPVKQIDPEVKQLPPDLHYAKETVRINADELPAVVFTRLKEVEPEGYEKSVVYHHKKGKYYIVEMREDGNDKTYRFDYEGRLLKAEERDGDDD
jgi:hypothetical protein